MIRAPWTLSLLATLGIQGCAPLPEATCDVEAGLPVFPGAVGFGTTTPAGRGGQTFVVTSLADDGPGTLREALEAEVPRTVVFDVSGEIALTRQIEIVDPYVTVAGQTAPGSGVVVTGAGLVVFTHDVLLQHLRIRPGLGPVKPENNDALTVEPLGDVEPHHVVLDHLSLSWSEDEVLAMHGVHGATLSWSLLGEALNDARHEKGPHSAGLLVGFGSTCVSVHHGALAHIGFRNPLLTNVGRVDYAANVAYDYAELAGEWLPDVLPGAVNLIGNAWRPGPASPAEVPAFLVYTDHPVHAYVESYHLLTSASRWALYAEDNEGPGQVLAANFGDPFPEQGRVSTPFPGPSYAVGPASAVWDVVLPQVGATRPVRDGVDARIVASVIDGTGGLVDDPADVGGPDVPAASPRRTDTDGDALPDDWERDHGGDPLLADADLDPDGDGYTRLEDWLHALSEP